MNEATPLIPRSRWRLTDIVSLVGEAVLLVLGPVGFLFVFSCMIFLSNDLDQTKTMERLSIWVFSCQTYLMPGVASVFLLWRYLFRPRTFFGAKGVFISVGGTAAVSLFGGCCGLLWLAEHEYHLRIINAETAKVTIDCRQLAEECMALLDESKRSDKHWFEQSELPPLIARLRPLYVFVSPIEMRIELTHKPFAGGEYSHGFYFTKKTNKHVYELEWYAEYDSRELLLTLPVVDEN